MTETKTPAVSLGDIGLCLSGGGYRAAAFHLGTLKMLHELGLLHEVRNLSTVSGGTIVGAAYALSKANKVEFADFVESFQEFLSKNNVIELAFEELKNQPNDRNSKKRSLIRGAAAVYNANLFNGARFETLMDNVGDGKPFDDLIFNATEFRSGNAFRFRAHHSLNTNQTDKTIGNGDYRISKKLAKTLRIADIVAASSCFPGGFEPINFPQDFDFGEVGPPEFPFHDEEIKSVPLMDGGIYDNQGLDSLTLDEKTDSESDEPALPFNLLIISDTTQRTDNMSYDFEAFKKNVWYRRILGVISHLPLIAAVLFAVLLLSSVMLISALVSFDSNAPDANSRALLIILPLAIEIFLMIPLIAFFVLLLNRQRVLDTLIGDREIIGEKMPVSKFIGHLSYSELVDFGLSRVLSLISMTSQVFMKRIRRLTTEERMKREPYKKNVVFNYIYDLNPTDNVVKLVEKYPELKVTEKLRTLSEDAEKVGTKLWFTKDDPHELNTLIECGRATACYSVLRLLGQRFLGKDENDKPVVPSPNEKALFDTALGIWKELR